MIAHKTQMYHIQCWCPDNLSRIDLRNHTPLIRYLNQSITVHKYSHISCRIILYQPFFLVLMVNGEHLVRSRLGDLAKDTRVETDEVRSIRVKLLKPLGAVKETVSSLEMSQISYQKSFG